MAEGGLAALDKLTALLADYPRWNWPAIHALAENLGRAGQEDAYRIHENLLRWSIDALVKAKATRQPPPGVLKQLDRLGGGRCP